jgi:hypothetical protein
VFAVRRVAVVLLVGVVTACGGAPGLPFTSAEDLEAAHRAYVAVADREIEIDRSGDVEDLRGLFVEDIVIVDGDETAEGIDELVWISAFIEAQDPDYTFEHTATYTGLDDGIVVMDQWGWQGYTEDAPLHEYRIYQTDDGMITAWEALYDMDTRVYFGTGGVDDEAYALRDAYLGAWASRDAAAIAALYADGGVRLDPLFEEAAEGRPAIEEQFADVLDRLPVVSLELVDTIGLRSHERVDVGTVVEITWDAEPACAVEAVFWLESDDGLITRERAYYDVPSLVACGWIGS